MGASGWYYFVPYQESIVKALRELRKDVFKRGEYESSFVRPPDHVDLAQVIDAWWRSWHRDLSAIRELTNKIPDEPGRKPRTIRQLLEQCGENGTHSILDITGVSGEPALGKVSPLGEADLTRLFGTVWPTREMAEARLGELMDRSDRWFGNYLVVYKDDQPDEILFVGASGD